MPYLDLVGSFIYREPVYRAKLDALAENDEALKDAGWAANTKTLFLQPTVPAGWTQVTTQNDKALRVVGPIGGAGSGGSQALSASLTLQHTHTLVTPAQGSHTHVYSNHTHPTSPVKEGRRGAINVGIADSGGFLYTYGSIGSGSTSITLLANPWASPGALVLGTEPDHNHGAPATMLSNFAFTYVDVLIGTKDALAGVYTDLTSFWSAGTKVDFDPFDLYADNDAYNNSALMPGGSVMLFGQPTAPLGWTKLTSLNDRLLRVVSGTGGGTGGGQIPSASIPSGHTHILPSVPDHVHSFANHIHHLSEDGSTSGSPAEPGFGQIQESQFEAGIMAIPIQNILLPKTDKTVYRPYTVEAGGGNSTPAGGHTHPIVDALDDFALAYLDVIQASKDSVGAPYAYLDMTSVFTWKKLVSKQRLNNLAKNDSHIQFHTTPSGTKAFFFMAAPPFGWTKITSQHDTALRVVAGASGGSAGGGFQLLSQPILLAHYHVVEDVPSHTHLASHTHNVATGVAHITDSDVAIIDYPNPGIGMEGIRAQVFSGPGSGAIISRTIRIVTPPPDEIPTSAGGHDHGGLTDSQLADIMLAYADVIWCQKD